MKSFTALACLLGGLAMSRPSTADEGVDARAKAQAEALFREGKRLYDAGDYAASCPKLEGAVALTKGEALGGKMLLAACYEHVGRKASALGLYAEVATRATTMGQATRAKEAEAHRDSLGPLLPKLDVHLAPNVVAPPGLVVRVGGVEQPLGALGVALPVDAGAVTVTATAPGKAAYTRDVVIVDQPGTVTVALGPFVDATPAPASPEPPSAPSAVQPADPTGRPVAITGALPATHDERFALDAPSGPRAWSKGKVIGATVGGVGATTAIVGFVVGGIAKAHYDDAKATGGCDASSPPVCESVEGMRGARDLGSVATALVIGGGAMAAIGTVAFVLSGSSESSTAARLTLHPSFAGGSLEVSF